MPRKFSTKLDRAHIPVVANAVRAGLPLRLCAGLIGVTPGTVHRWRELGEAEGCTDPDLVEFAVAYGEARAQAALDGVRLLNEHGASDWKAKLEVLKASDPDTWVEQRRQKVELDVKVAPKRDYSALSETELRLLEALESKILSSPVLALPGA